MNPSAAKRRVALTGALALAHASVARAAGGESTPLRLSGSPAAHVSAGGGSSILRTIAGLLIVIAVIYAVTWLLKRIKRRQGREGRASGTGLTQVATLPLGPGRSLALVRAGRELVLLGLAEHGVTEIRTYTQQEAEAVGLQAPPQPTVLADEPVQTFSERAVRQLRRLTVRS